MTRIAFTGKAGVGKTTAAEYFMWKYGFIKYSFAGAVKGIAGTLWPEAFKGGAKPRKLLQAFGMCVCTVDKDVWVNYVLRQIHSLPSKVDIVIDDCRFLNEADLLHRQGFIVVRILGPQRVEIVGDEANHVSETEQAAIIPDFELENYKEGVASLHDAIDSAHWVSNGEAFRRK